MIFARTVATTVLALGVLSLPLAAQQNIEPSNAGKATANSGATPTYSHDQLLTATVHQAWLLSGKSEDNFFSMVQQLAEISAKNRDVTLPESADAGRRMGNYIKRLSKSDTDQLLYAVVDKAVVMVTHVPVRPAGHATPPPAGAPAK